MTVLSPDDLDHLEEMIDIDDVRHRLEPAISALPPTLSDAVRMRCLDGEEYDEIARVLDIRAATVRKRVSRGLRQLEDLLGENPFRTHG